MFVILSHQRAGSNLLRDLLNSHPELRCYGEPWSSTPQMTSDPTSLGEKEGFLAKYNQVIKKEDKVALIWDTKIIHLRRRNRHKQAASHVAMRRTGIACTYDRPEIKKVNVWTKHIKGRRGVGKIRRAEEDFIQYAFPNVLDVYYEDLTEDKEITILPAEKAAPILEFLGVEVRDLTTSLIKTELYEIVGNKDGIPTSN